LDAESLARTRWKPAEKALAKREQIAGRLREARARVAELTFAHPAAVERDRQARGYALAEGMPTPQSEAEQIARELDEAQEHAKDLEAAAVLVEDQLREVRDANRESWVQSQERAIEQAGKAVLTRLEALEQEVGKLEDERGLLAWIEPVSAEGSVDPHGGRPTHTGTVAAALDQLRAAVSALAAGEESGKPPPGRESSWVEKRLAAKARSSWGG